jgi:predicted secreted hydrolase
MRPTHRRASGLAAAAALLSQLAAAAPPAAQPAQPGEVRAAPEEFARVDAPHAFVFPRDHGPHPQFRQEWWYVTGNLDGAGGERFGFELTFFRFALAPGAAAGARPDSAVSAWRTREIWMAHFAVSDVSRRRFRFAQKLSREALGLAGAAAVPAGPGSAAADGAAAPRLWIDDWLLEGAPASVAGAGTSWRLRASQPGYAIELTLEPETAPVLNGEHGLSRKSAEAGAASYYYSVPRLAVHGRLLTEHGPRAVEGLAWLDREWGSGSLGAQQSGWDWFGLQLDDGSALMFYALRDRSGGREPFSAGTWIAADGTRPLSSDEVRIDVTGQWTNRDGDHYPAGWRLRVPSLGVELALRPVLADQELRTTPRYWEGAVDVSGTRGGRRVGGRGYVELVGYAQERPGEHDAGAPVRSGR